MEQWRNNTDTGNQHTQSKTCCPSASLFTSHLMWTQAGSNQACTVRG